MLERNSIEEKMKERRFVIYATVGNSKIQFISEHMYDIHYEERTSPRERVPIINIIVDLNTEEFQCAYNLKKSITTLNTPTCGSVMNDEHFDKIVTRFEAEAKWMSRLAD